MRCVHCCSYILRVLCIFRDGYLILFYHLMLISFFFHSFFFLGPAAFCQRSQCSVPFALSAQHAEQSGARTAALEEAGPGTEKIRLRPPCCSQLNCSNGLKQKRQNKTTTTTKIHCDGALSIYRFFSLICVYSPRPIKHV